MQTTEMHKLEEENLCSSTEITCIFNLSMALLKVDFRSRGQSLLLLKINL